MQRSTVMVRAVVAVAVSGFGATAARAASDTWKVGTNGDYSVAANWVGGNVPNGAADVATIEGAGSVVAFSGGAVMLADLDLAQSTAGATPTFNQTGGTLSVNRLRFGGPGGSRNPTYNLTDATLNIASAFTWGNGNNARFNYGSGATVDYSGTGFFSVGVAGGANGGIVGSGNGVFNANAVTALRLGSTTGGTGSINLGDTSQFNGTAIATFYLGNNGGTGVLTVGGGGALFNAPAAAISVGQFGAGSGTINMSGNGRLVATRLVLGGDNAASAVTGVISLNGGTIEAGSIRMGSSTVTPSPTANAINANGGTVKALTHANNGNFFGGVGAANALVNLLAGGLNFDTNGNDVTIINDMTGTGGLTKLGNGTLSLTGPNSYTGTTVVTAGTLRLGAADALADASTLVLNGGTLNADGASDLIGSLDVTTASGLQFGEADGTAHALTFAAAGTGSGPLTVTNWSDGIDQFLFTSEAAAESIASMTTFINPSGAAGSVGATVVPSGDNFAVVPVPEPAGLALWGLGAVAVLTRCRRSVDCHR